MKPFLKRVLRSAGLMRASDSLLYQWTRYRNRKDNSAFLNENPEIPIPPDYLLYEAHQLKYRSYFEYGRDNARKISEHFKRFIDLDQKRLLDWGCGPARIIRHMREFLPQTELYGSDYNAASISWNSSNISGVKFTLNALNPPMPFEDEFFDAIYGLSIFTHLSEENHSKWIKELHRIAKKNAVILITTHGAAFKERLSVADTRLFDSGKVVIHGNTLEGHRTYAAYQPPKWFRNLLKNHFNILEHRPGEKVSWGIEQDRWTLAAIK